MRTTGSSRLVSWEKCVCLLQAVSLCLAALNAEAAVSRACCLSRTPPSVTHSFIHFARSEGSVRDMRESRILTNLALNGHWMGNFLLRYIIPLQSWNTEKVTLTVKLTLGNPGNTPNRKRVGNAPLKLCDQLPVTSLVLAAFPSGYSLSKRKKKEKKQVCCILIEPIAQLYWKFWESFSRP